MSLCSFNINFTDTPDSLVLKAKTAITNVEHAEFTGDNTTGSFSLPTPLGIVKGIYFINGQIATFTITEKSFLIPCGMIENKIKGYIEQN